MSLKKKEVAIPNSSYYSKKEKYAWVMEEEDYFEKKELGTRRMRRYRALMENDKQVN